MRVCVLVWVCVVCVAGEAGEGVEREVPPQYCQKLEQLHSNDTGPQEVSIQGHPLSLAVQWDGRAPGRAAASLLTALLRRVARYTRVTLARTHDLPLAQVLFSNDSIYDFYQDLSVCPAAAQHTGVVAGGRCAPDRLCGLRRAVLGPGAAPASPVLLASLARPVRGEDECRRLTAWTAFFDNKVVERCGFTRGGGPVMVYYLRGSSDLRDDLTRRVAAAGLRWRVQALAADHEPRTELVDLMRAGNQSFLFVDYEVWATGPGVWRVQPPPCPAAPCGPLDGPVYTVSVGHVFALDQFMPNALSIIRQFSPSHQELREVLEEEAALGEAGEEAACKWALAHRPRVQRWVRGELQPAFWVAVLVKADADMLTYARAADLVTATVRPRLAYNVTLVLLELPARVSDYDLTDAISKQEQYRQWSTLLGVVGAGEGGETAAAHVAGTEMPLVLYGGAGGPLPGRAARAARGAEGPRASALARLMADCGWQRLAVLSDGGAEAAHLLTALKNTPLAVRNSQLASSSSSDIAEHLEAFQAVNARIFFINADAETTRVVLCEATARGLSAGRVWLVREGVREGEGAGEGVPLHYSVSGAWRGFQPTVGGNSDVDWEVRDKLLAAWGLWPAQGAALADALLLLLHAAGHFLGAHPQHRHDLHGRGTAELFWSAMSNHPARGVTGKLVATQQYAADPVVYVDEWGGAGPRSRAVWAVRGGVVEGAPAGLCAEGVTDGGKQCITMRRYSAGDGFTWRCHDWSLLWCALTLAAAGPALYAARRARLARLVRHERMLKAALAARCDRTARALQPHLVDRAALELRRELGAGRFGRVRLAVLRAPRRAPLPVAAKALQDDAAPADEAEFLREACTLASLSHAHVVRLAGVCAAGGPPLVLMEYAFFGDLAAYLRERRYLAELPQPEGNPEAEHVSAKSLTRLGSEAASALDYLASKRLVHRDVRAANCLVDATRSLKLADFGMARQTASSSEYWCRRRGLFPVLWMAPESLARGVFSSASDVWSLGVLLLELVSLGGRPYGRATPSDALRVVLAGGCPPLPPDAGDLTRGILRGCWRREGARRPGAGAVCSFLRAHPAALPPALLPAPPPQVTDLDDDGAMEFATFAMC